MLKRFNKLLYPGPPRTMNQFDDSVLMRDYIDQSLYEPTHGFFQQEKVITPFTPIDYRSMKRRSDYIRIVRDYQLKYQEFMTPVELYQPYYGESLARYMSEMWRNKKDKPLIVYEGGGGRGTNAMNILDYLKESEPDIYDNVEYHMIDISETLLALQRERLEVNHAGKVSFYRKDISQWDVDVPEECFVILLEVFDNFPHDKIYEKHPDRGVEEIWVETNNIGEPNETRTEVVYDLQDEWIIKYLERTREYKEYEKKHVWSFWDRIFRMGSFIPTHQLMFIENVLSKRFPRHHAIISDFDYLPGLDRTSERSPIIQRREYLTPTKDFNVQEFREVTIPKKHTVDIFFETNFPELEHVYKQYFPNYKTDLMKHETFMLNYADYEQCLLSDGYNPFLKEFLNQSFFLSHPNDHA